MPCENTLGLERMRSRGTVEFYEIAVVERAARTGSYARISESAIESKSERVVWHAWADGNRVGNRTRLLSIKRYPRVVVGVCMKVWIWCYLKFWYEGDVRGRRGSRGREASRCYKTVQRSNPHAGN